MPDLKTILTAKTPLTLSGVPAGFQPSLLADLARAAKGRAVFIAPDDAAMRAVAATAPFFAPELEVIVFPAWDCLPYDRASPTLRIMAERIAALYRLQRPAKGPQLVLTTANAATQRVLTPFRIRQLVATLEPGARIDRDDLAKLLQANGYVRTETVHDQGEYAVRGGIVDLYPSGEEQALRLDFFGDEIETVRTFSPEDQRTTGRIDGFTLLPASEALLDEESIKRFRTRYRDKFGATATGDPLYQAISDGRRLAGMEHWLPLFEDKLATLFDHLSADDVIVRDFGVPGAVEGRMEAVADYYENRQRAEAAQRRRLGRSPRREQLGCRPRVVQQLRLGTEERLRRAAVDADARDGADRGDRRAARLQRRREVAHVRSQHRRRVHDGARLVGVERRVGLGDEPPRGLALAPRRRRRRRGWNRDWNHTLESKAPPPPLRYFNSVLVTS